MNHQIYQLRSAICLFLLLLCGRAQAQDPLIPDPYATTRSCRLVSNLQLSTALNPVRGPWYLDTTGYRDAKWIVHSYSPALAALATVPAGTAPFIVEDRPEWGLRGGGCHYVSCRPENGYPTSHAGGPYVMTLRRYFRTCLPDSLYFYMRASGDDTLKSVSIDGHLLYVNPGVATTQGGAWIQDKGAWVGKGSHYLEVVVANSTADFPNPQAQHDNYFGFALQGWVYAYARTLVSESVDQPNCECLLGGSGLRMAGEPAGDRPEAIQKAASSGLKAPYPNPARQSLNVPVSGNGQEVRVQLCDLQGRVLRTAQRPVEGDSEITLGVGSLQPGLYLITVEDGAGKTAHKIMIEQ